MPDLPLYIVIAAAPNRYVLLKTSYVLLNFTKFWKFELIRSPNAVSEFMGSYQCEPYEYSHCRTSSRHPPVYYKNTMIRTGRFIQIVTNDFSGEVCEYKMSFPNRILPSAYCRISRGEDTSNIWCFEPKTEKIPYHVLSIFVNDAISKGIECPISMDTLSLGKIGCTPCGHLFNYESILRYFKTSASCPTCRSVCNSIQKI